MKNLKKKSRKDLEKYIRELETELKQIPNAPVNANLIRSDGTSSKELPITNKPILIIEDDDGLSTLIEKTLKKSGFEVTRVKTGTEAIEKVENDSNILLLLDFGLPDMKGDQLIQKLEENQRAIPFIIMTGSGDEKTAVEMMKLGARDYLIKDSNILDTLPEVIHRVNRELFTETQLKQLQEALRETQKHLHSVIDTTPIILWSIDNNGIITLSEGRALEQLSLQPGQLVGQSVFDVYAKDLEALDAIQRGLAGEEFSIDIEVGGCVWNNHYTPILNEENGVAGLIGISMDTTERQQAIEALRESEEKYRHLIENTNDLVYAADAEGILTYMGPQSTRYGFAPEEVISKNMLDFITPQDHARIIEEFTHTIQTGEVFNSQFRLVDKNGNLFWLEDHANTIIDESGNIVGISGTLRDVTDRKKAENKLRASEAKFRTIFENASDLIVCLDECGIIVEVNDRIEEIFGFKPEEVIGSNFSQFSHLDSEVKQTANTLFDKVISTGITGLTQVEARRKDGSKLIVEASNRFIQTLDGQQNVLAIIRDITERKQAEEEIQKLASVVRYSSELVNIATLDGMMVFLNAAGGEMLGIEPHEVTSTQIMQVIPDHLMELVTTELLPTLMSGKSWEGDLQYLNLKTGELTDVHAMTFTVKDPSTGEPLYLANVSMDITERKRAEEELIKNRNLLDNAERIADLGGWELDLRTGEIVWTEGLRRLHEFPPDYQPTADEIVKLCHPEDMATMEQAIKGIIENGDSYDMELRIITSKGNVQWSRSVGEVETKNGEVVRLRGIAQNITNRKQTESELKKKLAELEQYKKVTIDRELKMIELKGIINDLEEKLKLSENEE